MYRFNGREIDRSDGFLMSFDSTIDAVNFSLEWQNSSNTTFTWQVRDGSDGFIYYQGTDLVSANDCLTLGLTYKKIQQYLNSK